MKQDDEAPAKPGNEYDPVLDEQPGEGTFQMVVPCPPLEVESVDFSPPRAALRAAVDPAHIAHPAPASQPASFDGRGIDFRAADPTSRSSSEHILRAAIQSEYRYGQSGLILGLACILGGVVLGLNGVAGSTSWTAALLGLRSEINDAAPGVVLFIVGIFFVWITKPKVNLRDLKG